jgi:SAM-dependent methyltransferase
LDRQSQTEQDRIVYDVYWTLQPPGARAPHESLPAVLDQIECRPGATLIDLGCGTGRNALIAAERGFRVLAVDHNARAVEQLSAAATARGLPIEVEEADFVSWMTSHRDEADAVICINALHHVSPDAMYIRQVLRGMVDLLHEGGLLLIGLLTEIRYGNLAPPPGRLLMSEEQGRELLTTSLQDLELVELTRDFGRKDNAILFDRETNALVETFYEAVQVNSLFRKGNRI